MNYEGKLTKNKMLNSLPNYKILVWSKWSAFADNKINVNEKLKIVLGRVKNIVGKRENAGNQHFLLFPQCFQKASYKELNKVVIVWYRVKPILASATCSWLIMNQLSPVAHRT